MNPQMNNPMNNPQFNQMNNPMNNPMNNFPMYQPIPPQSGVQTPFYSQPILSPAGMVYSINSPQDLNTIPAAPGLNIYFCESENKIYMRIFNNGNIEIKEYFLLTEQNQKNNCKSSEELKKLTERITNIEKQLQIDNGGPKEWQL